ncbi:MAG TPA: hypothetical protein PKA28_03110 [Methylomusa anaerophila]|uniref:ECF transporter S component n=1 Tax=Methylomusa anaerophila TaxID=1930071 RepID=A0A348ANT5_9FIRM|nr:hypothetical protein [Methylomusa anaerophila]BBB92733.1 hypothetical protein MAMMFC1_03428 [Methylomusa anaerophila]HML87414.1 hypothetical protein [Methylomusa anaerophila]
MHKVLTRTALLLALTLLFQSLRFFIPIPPLFSTFIIGSLVNASLLIAAETVGIWPALLIAAVTPIVAYFQQLLVLPVFIIPVALGNASMVVVYLLTLKFGKVISVGIAAFTKTCVLYGLFTWLLALVVLPPKVAALLMFVMSWPQFVTGIIGGILAVLIAKRLKSTL